jgi:transposase
MSQSESRQALAVNESEGQVAEPEVVPRAKRRQFSAAYKLRIVEEADRCTEHGQIGALLRREGLYSSQLSSWREQRSKGQLAALSPQQRGRKVQQPSEMEVARLQQENERLRARLEQAELIIDVQKKLSQLLGLTPDETEIDDNR